MSNYRAQYDIERAVQVAQWNSYSWEEFLEQARESWVGLLREEADRVASHESAVER